MERHIGGEADTLNERKDRKRPGGIAPQAEAELPVEQSGGYGRIEMPLDGGGLAAEPHSLPRQAYDEAVESAASCRRCGACRAKDTLRARFEAQVRQRPEAAALIADDASWSYAELDRASDKVVRELQLAGAGPGTVVGLLMERSPALLAALLGIVKAGCAFLPLEPQMPAERLSYMLADSGASVLLTESALRGRAAFAETVIVCGPLLISPPQEWWLQTAQRAAPLAGPRAAEAAPSGRREPGCGSERDLAYVIYTSGSTGRPKGVAVEYGALLNLCRGLAERIAFEPGRTMLFVTSVSFDIFIVETVLPLVSGMTVVVAGPDEYRHPRRLCALLQKQRVDLLQLTPSRLLQLLPTDPRLSSLAQVKDLLLGGEALPESLAETVLEASAVRLFNMYGPTETAVWSSVGEVSRSAPELRNVLAPIHGTRFFLERSFYSGEEADWHEADGDGGETGELCIAGAGIARGYVNRTELTASAFATGSDGERYYRTGDLAKLRADGQLELIGRIGEQVKIRGHRVEPGEVEAAVLRFTEVESAAAVPKRDGERVMGLHLFYTSGQPLEAAAIRSFLGELLPDYMLPASCTRLAALPLTSNGKIDRKRLIALLAEERSLQ